MKPNMRRADRARADWDFLDRVVLRRAEEQALAAELHGQRERDKQQIVGPQSLIVLTAPRRRCRGGCKRWEHTRGYCVYCYNKVRHGRPLDDEDEEEL